MNWQNEEKILPDSIGFVYLIKHKITGDFYIGKKNLISYKTINKKKVYKESNWKNYYGSNKEFLSYIKEQGKEMFTRTILIACNSPYKLTYTELKYQILCDWENDKCWNSNLLGKFYKQKIIK